MTELNENQETKIALVIEGIEGLICAVGSDHVDDARQELREHLREFLLPAIRIIDGGKQAAHPHINIVCQECGATRQCLTHGIGACPDWAAAIKTHYTKSDGDGEVA